MEREVLTGGHLAPTVENLPVLGQAPPLPQLFLDGCPRAVQDLRASVATRKRQSRALKSKSLLVAATSRMWTGVSTLKKKDEVEQHTHPNLLYASLGQSSLEWIWATSSHVKRIFGDPQMDSAISTPQEACGHLLSEGPGWALWKGRAQPNPRSLYSGENNSH